MKTKQKHDGWVLRDKKGNFLSYTYGLTKITCWIGAGFETVVQTEGPICGDKYWHCEEAAIRSAERRGWKLTKVKFQEVP